jgi:hypothetical protein
MKSLERGNCTATLSLQIPIRADGSYNSYTKPASLYPGGPDSAHKQRMAPRRLRLRRHFENLENVRAALWPRLSCSPARITTFDNLRLRTSLFLAAPGPLFCATAALTLLGVNGVAVMRCNWRYCTYHAADVPSHSHLAVEPQRNHGLVPAATNRPLLSSGFRVPRLSANSFTSTKNTGTTREQ